MLNGLGSLMKAVVRSFPIQDFHSKKRQKGWIVDLRMIHVSKPLCPLDHMGPKLIVKKQVRVRITPPTVVGSFRILSSPQDPVEGILGDLSISLSVSYKQEQRGKLP